MAGSIFFEGGDWAASSSRIFFVLEFLASKLPEGPDKDELQELDTENLPFLDLRPIDRRQLVDLIADELPTRVQSISDASSRKDLEEAISDLVRLARLQQAANIQRQKLPGDGASG
ncbi:hypothetical protein TUM20985_27580 [Mycobacterium antarcticum]|uniref:hypothetical protein n=1 Tax=unclassified Mycolicibacterium TaxID=2636767 RepID=UPI00239F63FD|nr:MULTISPECIES: hypothetical protein [unclassified Mycolicibacterium]BDX32211.1 hypothetical protein TUM20985_27580 [Mycolicibacterium sp. TUM20985]GLP75507.1 hypothetical protein TUM20983_26170 [Mycolicibacterium sp. TUM20983]GLP84232.1 hypothetical protein TUM20984_56520 [Mycolicibacterium sp. TUM20984]